MAAPEYMNDSVGSLNTLWMLQKCSLNLFVAEYIVCSLLYTYRFQWT